MTYHPIDIAFPHFPAETAAAAAGGDTAAMAALGHAVFGEWPLPAGAEADRWAERFLPHYLRALFPYSLPDAAISAAIRRIADVFETRIVKRFKPDRGHFADWLRLNLHDLALQEGISQLQAGFGPCETALQALPAEEQTRIDLNRLNEVDRDTRQRLQPCFEWQEQRRAICELVWMLFFFVPPDEQPKDGMAMSPAAAWVAGVARKAVRGMGPAKFEEWAQQFLMEKILATDFLMRFKPDIGSSFIQWLKTSVENYTRDQLAKTPEPELISFSDAMSQSLGSSGQRVSRTTPRAADDEGADLGAAAETAGLDADDEFLDSFRPLVLDDGGGGGGGGDADGSDRLQTLLRLVLPVMLADPYHRTFCKLFLGLPLSRDDFALIVRERLTLWAAELAVEWLAGPGLLTLDELEADPRLRLVRQRFVQFCELATGNLRDGAPIIELDADRRGQTVEWFRVGMTPGIQAPGRKRKTIELPAAFKSIRGASDRAKAVRSQLQQALMAVEHQPAPGDERTIFEALIGVLDEVLEDIERDRQIQSRAFRDEMHAAISKARTQEKRMEARMRSIPVGSPEYGEAQAKLAKYRRTQATKAEELGKKSFGPKDAEIGRLLGIEPTAVPGLKTRIKKNLAEFWQADFLTKLRKTVVASLRGGKPAKATFEHYEKRLEALAAFEAFPNNLVVRSALSAVMGERMNDADIDRYADLVQSLLRGFGDTTAMTQALDAIRGHILGRDELARLGANPSALAEFETAALAYYPAVVWLKRLGNVEE